VISNNLANVSTTGFKRSHAVFEDLMYQNLRQVGANSTEQATLPTGLQVGLGVRTVATSRNFAQGNLQQTGNKPGRGDSGRRLLPGHHARRHHRLHPRRLLSGELCQGALVTATGLAIANGVTVPANATAVSIAGDGTVSATVPGSTTPQGIGSIAWPRFINPAGLTPLGQTCMRKAPRRVNRNGWYGRAPTAWALMQGFMETSNVNVVQELVTMIQTQRAYEMNSKAIQTSDQMLQKLGQL
jgi:flagellar basal-body rod protein FlgG